MEIMMKLAFFFPDFQTINTDWVEGKIEKDA